MSTDNKSSNVQNVIANAFSNVAQAPTDNPPIKENIMSFRSLSQPRPQIILR